MKLSNLIGKQVFCVYDASIVGTIHDVVFDEKYKKILGIYFFDQDENEFYIKKQNIYSICDFVTIKNTNSISTSIVLDKPLSPLGKLIVGTNGENFGNITDIEIDDNFSVQHFETNQNKQVLPTQVIFAMKNFVYGENVHIASFRPRVHKIQNSLQNLTVKIMDIPKIEEQKQRLMPTKITVNSDILIGKRLSKDIIGKNNEMILKQNQVLSAKHILIAKQHDKLNELFYSVYWYEKFQANNSLGIF